MPCYHPSQTRHNCLVKIVQNLNTHQCLIARQAVLRANPPTASKPTGSTISISAPPSIKLDLQPRLLRRRALRRLRRTMPVPPHHIHRLSHETTLVENLRARRHVNRGVLIEEVHRFEMHLHDLARHDGEVLHPRDMINPELDPEDNILVDDVVLAVRPGTHTGATARLVGVEAAGVELAVAVGGDVEVVVGELGALVVEGLRVGEDFLEGRGDDLVADGFVVDGVADGGVLDLEGAVGVGGEVEAGGVGDEGLGDGVAGAVRVPVFGDGHGVGLVVDEPVGVAFDHGVDAQGEDVLVVGGEDARVDDGAPGDADGVEVVVDGLGGEDAGGADFVGHFAGLVEHEGHDVLVVADGDDGLEDEFAVAHDRGTACAVVGVFPADAGVLLVDTDGVWERYRVAFVVGNLVGEVLDMAEAVAA